MFKGHFATGSITGTGAAINVSLGFAPTLVRIRNRTSRIRLEWDDDMTAGHGNKIVAAGTGTLITANGISPYAGTDTASVGFTIGTDSVNVNAELLFYEAFGQD